MPLHEETLQQWRDRWGDVAVPQNMTVAPNIDPIALRILQRLVDDEDLVNELERQHTMSAIDFILTYLIWKSEGITDYYSAGLPGMIRFAPRATPSEFISRARRVLTSGKKGNPVWQLPPVLLQQSERAEQSMSRGFSKGHYKEEKGL